MFIRQILYLAQCQVLQAALNKSDNAAIIAAYTDVMTTKFKIPKVVDKLLSDSQAIQNIDAKVHFYLFLTRLDVGGQLSPSMISPFQKAFAAFFDLKRNKLESKAALREGLEVPVPLSQVPSPTPPPKHITSSPFSTFTRVLSARALNLPYPFTGATGRGRKPDWCTAEVFQTQCQVH